MALYLDSANPTDAKLAKELGITVGITTNPTLLSHFNQPADEIISKLWYQTEGMVFYQLSAAQISEREEEAYRFLALRPGKIALKIPCTIENLSLAAKLGQMGHMIAVTAIFSPAQVYLACQTGIRYIIPFANRSTGFLGDGPA